MRYETTEVPMVRYGRTKLFTPVVTAYLIISLLASLLTIPFPQFVYITAISANSFMSGQIWTPLTFTFISGEVFQFILNSLIMLFLGSFIEKQWKSVPFAIFLGTVSVLSGLFWILVTAAVGSPDAMEGGSFCIGYALMIVYGLLNRNAYMQLPTGNVRTLHVMIGCILISVIINLQSSLSVILLCGGLWGYLYMVVLNKISSAKATVSHSARPTNYDKFVDID